VLGFLSFGASIHRPIERQITSSGGTYLTPAQQDAQQTAALKTRDTDGDGLSDYDELYVYKTSPYLRDSDSDGFDDNTEILSGNDPNCPEGKQCGVTASAGADTTAPAGTTPAAATEADLLQAANSMSADDIRALLKQASVPEETYASLDDAALRKLFADTIQEAIASGALDALLNPSATPTPSFQSPTPTP